MPEKYGRLCIYDMDVFSYVAEHLAHEFDEVYYFNVQQGGPYPQLQQEASGEGVGTIIRVNEEEWYAALNKADVVMFPYLYTSGLQEFLRDQGYPVWGSGHASYLELDRWRAHQTMKSIGMPVPHAVRIEGIEPLREHLENEEDCFIKISYWRGQAETFHHTDMHLTNGWLDKLRAALGPLGATFEFIVEQPIKDAVEVGYDGFCVNGQWGAVGAIGYECKNMGYLGKVLPFSEIPAPVKYTLESVGPLLSTVALNLSNEIRVTEDGTPYVIDWTMRGGSPPTECLIEAFSNWGEIIYEGAHGRLAEPEPTCKYFAQVQIHSNWIKERWMPISFPAKEANWIKCYSKVEVDGRCYIPPVKDSNDVCAVTAIGDTMEATITQCMHRLESFEGIELEKKEDVFDDIMDQIEKGNEHGVDW